jgi:ubiquinone/menaquinone biosynthesis C-methylase UbiE
MYRFHLLVPKKFIWSRLHSSEYHPDVEGIIVRIETAKRNPGEYSLLQFWSEHLKYPLNVSGKRVLEIGHGGGWYLAEMLDSGARSVCGLEISGALNMRASEALKKSKYSNFELFLGNGRDFSALHSSSFDFIYANTVVQHLSTKTLKNYLMEISRLLTPEGLCVLQVLQTHLPVSQKRLSGSDLFSVAYTSSEFESLLRASGFTNQAFGEINYGTEDKFWGLYAFKKDA